MSAVSARPYADAAATYRSGGWGPLPLPAGRKAPPPTGWTGYGAPLPSGADVADWADNGHGTGNVALRLPETVIGLDVDGYDGKPGAETLAAAVARLGVLPATPVSTSRDDGVSGIRFYRVPAGRAWADVVGPGAEVIHHGHRYAVVAPSIHPEGRPYGWRVNGAQVPGPAVDDLPVLPEAWVRELDRGSVSDRVQKMQLGDTEVDELLEQLPAGSPCPYVTRVLDDALAELGTAASRHDTVNRHVGRLVRAGEQGHTGAGAALGTLHGAFRTAVGADPHRPVDPAEWHRSVSGAVALVQATPTAEADRGCCGHRLDELVPAELPSGADQVEQVELLRTRRGDELVLRRVRYLWAGRVPLGAVTVMPGEEGIGKSTLNARLAADVTRGTLPGELQGRPASVLIVAPEDHVEAVVAPRLVEAGADMSRIIFVDARLDIAGAEHEVILPRDLPALAHTVEAEGAALVLIDSLVTTLPEQLKSTAYKDMATVLKRLGAFAEAVDVAVLAPWHLNKSGGSDTALRMMDSRAFRTATRSVLLVVADPEKPGEGLVALDKANGGTLDVPALRYRLRSAPYLVTEVDEITGEVTEHTATCAVADWIGEEPGDGRQTARDLLVPAMERDDDPAAWLRSYLTDAGETAKQVVITAGVEAGMSARTIQRAAQKLRVIYRDVTEDRPGSPPLRRVAWRLPDDGRATVAPRSRHAPENGTNGATEALGGVLLSSSSQVRDGRAVRAVREDVRESGAIGGATVSSDDDATHSDADDDDACPDCGRDLDADPAPACAYRLHTQGVLR